MSFLLAAFALIHLALAAPFDGESLRWELRYAGVVAGHAWSTAKAEGEQVIIVGGAKNASWYAPIYTIDDWVRSTWTPGVGSQRYETRFREGGFHQDQDMRLLPTGLQITRGQQKDGGWKTWSNDYPAAPGAEDPVSALYAIRLLEGPGPWVWPVFSGRKPWPLVVSRAGRVVLDTVAGPVLTDIFDLRAQHEGDVTQHGRFLVYLSADARRMPVRASLGANIGTLRADLVSWADGAGATWGAQQP